MIFLSASLPEFQTGNRYLQSADLLAIKEAVRILAAVVLPSTPLVWGGHPSITPIIRSAIHFSTWNMLDNAIPYQSDFFVNQSPDDNTYFKQLKRVEPKTDRRKSLIELRNVIFASHKFTSAVFIGGMKGVEEEYLQFKKTHPSAYILPVASTGAAAKNIFYSLHPRPEKSLLANHSYMTMFRSHLHNFI